MVKMGISIAISVIQDSVSLEFGYSWNREFNVEVFKGEIFWKGIAKTMSLDY